MTEIEINEENLKTFIENIRNEDREELEYTYKNDYKKAFIEICLKEKNIWFLADKNKIPTAIGGIQFETNNEQTKGRVWFLSSKNSAKDILFILKYIKNKIDEFKNRTNIFYNYIFRSNFGFLRILKHWGFKVIDINSDIKLFYFSNFKQGGKIDT